MRRKLIVDSDHWSVWGNNEFDRSIGQHTKPCGWINRDGCGSGA